MKPRRTSGATEDNSETCTRLHFNEILCIKAVYDERVGEKGQQKDRANKESPRSQRFRGNGECARYLTVYAREQKVAGELLPSVIRTLGDCARPYTKITLLEFTKNVLSNPIIKICPVGA